MPATNLPSVDYLRHLFDEVNRLYFDGFLDPPVLKWNSRLRTSAGRFFPGSRKYFRFKPIIEVAAYLFEETDALELIRDTIAHEMIHYWLWVRRRPYGHGSDFLTKMRAMGVKRYNPVPRLRPFRYVYKCPACSKEFFARKKLGVLACAKCCRAFSKGRYDSQFNLTLFRTVIPTTEQESLKLNL
ncbi:MAG: hypothetical protein A3K03_06805 [Bdellovibrionales bacterium RIFOXYD1_FULL_44_7]|nr:MAG: hypothetical protein A3K03_06805 [Bdellovibrionales bacterium RIFOXYD1_FULL_44_7]